MTNVTFTGSEELFSGKYAVSDTCSYVLYDCCYCGEPFYLVDPDTFEADGCTRTIQYRNKETGEVVATNRSEGICMDCAKEIMRRQQKQKDG